MSERPQRLVFGEVAETYHAARPSYPGALVDEVLAFAGASAGDSALEVGAGTGKASVLFAERGLRLTCLEPSAEMAAVARRVLEPFPDVTVIESGFEEWSTPDEHSFRLLFSAQAWHWVEPEVRYRKAHEVLAADGALAVFGYDPDWYGLREEIAAIHPQLATAGPAGATMEHAAQEIEASGWFGEVTTREFFWEQTYATAEFLLLMQTHSNCRMLAEDERARVLGEIGALMDSRGGEVTVGYVAELFLARRL